MRVCYQQLGESYQQLSTFINSHCGSFRQIVAFINNRAESYQQLGDTYQQLSTFTNSYRQTSSLAHLLSADDVCALWQSREVLCLAHYPACHVEDIGLRVNGV